MDVSPAALPLAPVSNGCRRRRSSSTAPRSCAVGRHGGRRALVLCESVVFGRLAMGEQCREGAFPRPLAHPSRRPALFAEDMPTRRRARRSSWTIRLSAGGAALATLLVVAPMLPAGWKPAGGTPGDRPDWNIASAFDGMLVARMLTPSPDRLRTAILDLHTRLLGAAPRVWR